jgi:hypothetical protein
MGAGWFVQCADSGAQPLPHRGRALLVAQYQLEEFAREAALPPLKDFFSSDPAALAGYMRSQGVERDVADFPDEEFFDPVDALPTLRALIARLDDDPGSIASLAKVRDDLNEILRIVEAADQTGELFHIATAMPDLSDRTPGER